MEQSLNELDSGVIEAAKSMGVSHYTMVRHVMLPEALPSIINGVTIVLINLIGYSAIAGAIGGGGLGDLALQFGYYRRDTKALYIAVIIIIALVQIVQISGNAIRKALDKK